jgi:hypothetical protein
MSSAADKQRRHRERIASGSRMVLVEISPDIEQALIDAGLLGSSDDDRVHLREAVQRVLDTMAREAEARYR